MIIVLLSSVYPAKDAPKGTTPVVHYFTKEWVVMGHQVHVYHTESSFPKVFYLLVKPFKKLLDSKLGHLVPTQAPKEYKEEKDGVVVNHVTLKKLKPHGKFSNKQIRRVFNLISSCVEKEGVPDCFVGHWDNPQLELLHLLKEKYKRPTCLVYHCNQFKQLFSCYGNETESLVNDVDLVGFRNITAQGIYERLFSPPARSFIAASGVSKSFVEAGNAEELTSIIEKIRKMSPDELKTMSFKAKETAQAYSDEKVAKNYIAELRKIVL